MQPSLQTLVQQSFALGPYKQHKLGRAALFTTRFGLGVFVLGILWLKPCKCILFHTRCKPVTATQVAVNTGLAFLLFPDALGAFMHTGIVTAGERRALQTNGIVVAVVGYFYFIAGRNNAEWFFAGSILDRFAASAVCLVLMLIGSATLKQVAGQIVLDVGSAIYTYSLYQQDLADKQQQQD